MQTIVNQIVSILVPCFTQVKIRIKNYRTISNCQAYSLYLNTKLELIFQQLVHCVKNVVTFN